MKLTAIILASTITTALNAGSNVVITTAAVPGRRSPVIVTADAVRCTCVISERDARKTISAANASRIAQPPGPVVAD